MFFRTIWEIGGQMSWGQCLAESLSANDVYFVLDQCSQLAFYRAISLIQKSTDQNVAHLGHNIITLNQPVFAIKP